MRYREPIDPDGRRLPIKLDTTSNGEFEPVPLSPANRRSQPPRARGGDAEREAAGPVAPRLSRDGVRRGEHAARVQRGQRGRRQARRLLRPEPEAALDPQLAAARARAQGRVHLRRAGPLRRPDRRLGEESGPPARSSGRRRRAAGWRSGPARSSHLDCLGPEEFVKDVFMDSDTDLMVLSFVPSHARRRAGHDPGRRRGAPDRRPPGGHAPPAAARPRQPEPARRPRGDGRAEGELGRVRVEDLHAVRPGRQGLLPVRRGRHALHRESARARRQGRSACTRACPSASSPTSTASAATSASSRSAFPTSPSSSTTRASSRKRAAKRPYDRTRRATASTR